MAERRTVNPSELRTSELVMMLNPDTCALLLYGQNLEHAPDSEREFTDEVTNAMQAAAAELDRRLPPPGSAT